MDFTEKTLKENLIFDGIILHLYNDTVLLPNGKEATREYIRHQGAVCVVPVTENGEVVLVKQFRYPLHTVTLEVPAGKLDKGESPEEGARRELSEETGICQAKLKSIGALYSSPAIMTEVIHMYVATDLVFSESHPDEDEFVETVKIPLKKLLSQIKNGEIKDAKTQTAILKAALLLGELK